MFSNCSAFSESYQNGMVPELRLASDSFIQLIKAVEDNDITMLEFLSDFRELLESTKDSFPLVSWAVLKRMVTSLEATFRGAAQPCDAIKVEAKNADQICDCFGLMRDILRRIDISATTGVGSNVKLPSIF